MRNTAQHLQADYLEVPADIAALPDIDDGYGRIRDLHQAMVRDTTGQLKTLVEAFIAQTDPAQRAIVFQQLLYKWTRAEAIPPTARGPFMDARKVVVLERFYGTSLGSPDATYAVALEQGYRALSEQLYGKLLSRSHLQDLFDSITYSVDLSGFVPGDPSTLSSIKRTADLSTVITQLQTELTQDYEAGKVRLSEFARTLSEAQQGTPTAGDGVINGYSGNDVLYGTDRVQGYYGVSDWLFQGLGDAILVGGTGNDWLLGEAGSDTYLFCRGSGEDTILDSDPTAGNTDTHWLGSHLTPADITLRQLGHHVLSLNGTTDP